jgi:hypothetical protein
MKSTMESRRSKTPFTKASLLLTNQTHLIERLASNETSSLLLATQKLISRSRKNYSHILSTSSPPLNIPDFIDLSRRHRQISTICLDEVCSLLNSVFMEDIATTLRVIHQMMTTQWDSMVQFFIKRLKVIYQEQLVAIESPLKDGKIDSKHTIGSDREMKEGVRELVRRCG